MLFLAWTLVHNTYRNVALERSTYTTAAATTTTTKPRFRINTVKIRQFTKEQGVATFLLLLGMAVFERLATQVYSGKFAD